MSLPLRVVIVLVLVVAQVFLWAQVKQSALQLHFGQTNTQQFELVSQKLAESQDAFSKVQPHLTQLFEAFPPSNTISQVVGRIEALGDAKRLGVELKSIEDGTSSAVAKGKIITKRITIHVMGPMESMFSFLEALERQKEFASVESWDLTSDTQGSSSGPSGFQMTLHVNYYFYDANT